jgi:hypothetical protein
MPEEDHILTSRKRWIMQRMREGEPLTESSATFAIAKLGKDVEVELRLVEEMEAAGWIYVIGEMKGSRSWKLTQQGLELLAG